MKAEQLPNGALLVSDDAECIRILNECGILDMVVPRPPHNQVSVAFEYGEHWCLVVRHWGFAVESDNGYCIMALPKRSWSQRQAAAFFLEARVENSTTGVFECVFMEPQHAGNN